MTNDLNLERIETWVILFLGLVDDQCAVRCSAENKFDEGTLANTEDEKKGTVYMSVFTWCVQKSGDNFGHSGN